MGLDVLLAPNQWSLGALVGAVVVSALVILVFGTLLTRLADQLADRTGIGEAIFGAVALGASTSLPGSVMSVVVAYQGFPELAAANAVGGIAAQTAFLVIADLTYRRANLEHAAASLQNLLLGALLVTMLAFPLVVATAPATTIFGIHPATPLLFAGYLFGMHVVRGARAWPQWLPKQTAETREDMPHQTPDIRTSVMWRRFAGLVLVTGAAGLLVAQSGIGLVQRTGLGETAVGAYITAIVTSLPELVVTISAVRRGALTLAVSGIIGGNSFDVLFLAFSDISYRDGSLYHAISQDMAFLIAVTIVMTGTLMLGMLRRQQRGFAGIGFETVTVFVLYAGATLILFLT